MPLVSIVIPAYMPGDYLRQAILSVQRQTFTDWELIVVDDGSPQPVDVVTREFAFVRLVRQPNSGQAMARNHGIDLATGEYLAFLDQDDLWEPTKLERQVQSLNADRNLLMCHTQFDLIGADGRRLGDGFGRQQNYAQMLTGSGIAGSSSVMIRRNAVARLSGFDPTCQPAEDYDLWLRVAMYGHVGFIPSVETHYRMHSLNQSRKYRNTYRCIRAILMKHEVRARGSGDVDAQNAARLGRSRIKRTYAGQAIDQCREALRERCLPGAISEFMYASVLSPSVALESVLVSARTKLVNLRTRRARACSGGSTRK